MIVSALIDQREPEWCQRLTFDGVPTSVELLDTGDVIAITSDGAMLAFERKTASDLLSSLKANRLYPQVARLRELTPWAYLAICGALMPAGDKTYVGGVETGWAWSAVQGALLTVQELGIHIVNVPSDAEFEATVVRLCKRDRSVVRSDQPRDLSILSDGESLLARLPGIGRERARLLVEYCGSAGWALTFLTDPHWEGSFRGFGPETKRKVREALGLNAAEMLHVITPDGSPMLHQTEKELANA